MMLAENKVILTDDSKSAAPTHWSPEQETALMLHLCEAQMEAAVRDSDQAVDVLVRSFTELVNGSRAVADLAQQVAATASNQDAGNEELNKRCDAMSQQISSAVVAFQFYDKLSQRLGHVRHSLTMLAMFICDRSKTEDRDHWLKLMTALRRLYRTAEERAVFDAVAEGVMADEVRASVKEASETPDDDDVFF